MNFPVWLFFSRIICGVCLSDQKVIVPFRAAGYGVLKTQDIALISFLPWCLFFPFRAEISVDFFGARSSKLCLSKFAEYIYMLYNFYFIAQASCLPYINIAKVWYSPYSASQTIDGAFCCPAKFMQLPSHRPNKINLIDIQALLCCCWFFYVLEPPVLSHGFLKKDFCRTIDQQLKIHSVKSITRLLFLPNAPLFMWKIVFVENCVTGEMMSWIQCRCASLSNLSVILMDDDWSRVYWFIDGDRYTWSYHAILPVENISKRCWTFPQKPIQFNKDIILSQLNQAFSNPLSTRVSYSKCEITPC